MFGRRPDGTLVRDAPAVRRFMQLLTTRRNEALVYFRQDVDVEAALAFLDERNRDRPRERRITLFHLLLRALANTLHQRPRLNRFTAGGRLWQRHAVDITFSAKKAFDDDSPIITVKKRFPADEPLEEMVDRLHAELSASRGGRRSASDAEVDLLLKLPPFAVRGLLALARGADALGLLPAGMIAGDPLYTSAFVANLGSVGLDAGYHHLWQWGNCPVFCVLGRVHPGPDGRRRVTLKYSYDERVEDGLYCARGLELLKGYLEKPGSL